MSSNAAATSMFPVCITIDFDAESNWIARDAANLHRPIVLSNGSFGPKVGMQRVLDLLSKLSIPATFFIPGWVAEKWPHQVEDVVSRDHEVAHHGYLHEWPDMLKSRNEESELLERGSCALERVSGVRPQGYRSPGEFSPHTLELLVEHGFKYSSSFLDGDAPYIHEVGPERRKLVELPMQFQLDDAPFSAFGLRLPGRQLYPPRVMGEVWTGEFEALRALADCYYMLICHPQYVGRAGRMKVFEELLTRIKESNVWFVRCHELTTATLEAHGGS